MSPLHILKLPFSSVDGWVSLRQSHPSVLETFFFLTMPFSLIPPAMLIYAGAHHGGIYPVTASAARWQEVAIAFFVMELLTVPLVAWLIKQVASAHQIKVGFRDTFLLAAVTAIPMWLSAFGLAIPSLWPGIAILCLGVVLGGCLLFRGCDSFLRTGEELEAQAIAAEVFAGGALMWVALCAAVVLQLMNG